MTKTMESLIAEAEGLLPCLDEVLELSNSLMELSLDALATPTWGPNVHQSSRKAIETESRRQHRIRTEVVPLVHRWLERARAESPTLDRATIRRAGLRLRRVRREVDMWIYNRDFYRDMVVDGKRQHAEHAELVAENLRLTKIAGALDDAEPPASWH